MERFLRRKPLLVVSLGLICLVVAWSAWHLLTPPFDATSNRLIFIKKGLTLRKVAEILEKEGIIRSAYFFSGMTTILGKKGKIKAGEYEFHPRMRPLAVLEALTKGQVKPHLITLAEGYTLSQISQRLADSNIVDKEAFLQKATSPAFISSLGLPESAAPTLEGYLFPETYHFYREMEPAEVIQTMVQQFKKIFGPEWSSRDSRSDLSEREVVILASIIEKETSMPEEKPLVSAVFHNRLMKKIPLQSDPTVIYGIKDFNGNLTRGHLSTPTPYNTYMIAGLPPTPICNPGRDSLVAALNPAPVSYLYFVSKNDGAHFFSTEIEEHNRAVWKYQKVPLRNGLTKK
jgi:UPF0755 protein